LRGVEYSLLGVDVVALRNFLVFNIHR
jgi:hypothetical protein